MYQNLNRKATMYLYHICLIKSLCLVDLLFSMFLQCSNHKYTILPSLETPKGCLWTSISASQTEQTQSISLFTAVLLSQAHHTECLIAIWHSWKPKHTYCHAARQKKQDTISPFWLISLQLHGCTRKGHSTLGWTYLVR